MIRLLLLAALCAIPASGQEAVEVHRGNIKIRAGGTVSIPDLFRLKAAIEGRAEEIWTTTGVWVNPNQSLGFIVSKEFAALLDARASTEQQVMEERWKPVYQRSRVRCPRDCYILKSFARSQAWIKPQTVLFEAADHLRMAGQVRPEEAHLVRDGMILEYWDVKNPAQHFQARIEHYILAPKAEGERVLPAGTFTMDDAMGPNQFLPPGTDWEGMIVKKTNVLMVPTTALIRFGGDFYLKVSTGITNPDWTEITDIVGAKRKLLIKAGFLEGIRLQPGAGEELREPDSSLGEGPYSE